MAACIASYRSVYAEVSLRDTPTYPGVPEALEAIAAAAPAPAARRRDLQAARVRGAAAGRARAARALRGRRRAGARPARRVQDRHGRRGARRARRDGGPATMVGDRHVDMEAARAHGLRAVGVTWGFGTADELRDAGADVLVAIAGRAPRRGLGPPRGSRLVRPARRSAREAQRRACGGVHEVDPSATAGVPRWRGATIRGPRRSGRRRTHDYYGDCARSGRSATRPAPAGARGARGRDRPGASPSGVNASSRPGAGIRGVAARPRRGGRRPCRQSPAPAAAHPGRGFGAGVVMRR